MLWTEIIIVNYACTYWNRLTLNWANLSLWILLSRNGRRSLEQHNNRAASALRSHGLRNNIFIYSHGFEEPIFPWRITKKKPSILLILCMIHLIYINTIFSTTVQQKGLESYTYHMFQIITVWSLSGRKDEINSSFPLKNHKLTEKKRIYSICFQSQVHLVKFSTRFSLIPKWNMEIIKACKILITVNLFLAVLC